MYRHLEVLMHQTVTYWASQYTLASLPACTDRREEEEEEEEKSRVRGGGGGGGGDMDLKVASCPSQDAALTNMVYVSPGSETK